MAATFASYVLTQNMAITATITHLLLYNRDDLKSAWYFTSWDSVQSSIRPSTWKFWKKTECTEEELENMDLHYKLMLHYEEYPDWWYGVVWLVAGVADLICV